ncbi:MAG TPA: hypothetical protein EYP63_07780 [Desulfotomaculum sp.]|nr:hypothetical protein [Desulfotomaculum sp.]
MEAMKKLTEQFVHQLFLVIQGSVQAYLGVTENVPEDDREVVWREYNEAFERQILPQLLEVMERNQCGIAELCHGTLKLMGIGAEMVKMVETKNLRKSGFQTAKAWFVPIRHKGTRFF